VTNYLATLLATSLFAGACCAAGAPAATKPAAARYTQAAGTGSLKFSFVQAGAESQGSFRQFSTELGWDPANPAAGSLKVTVQVPSLDTQDKDRDEALRGADLFDAGAHPTARYVATSFAKRPDGTLEAVGKLTLRGVTKDLRLPLTIKSGANGLELSGTVVIQRLDFGVGQGEWKSTEWVGDDVKLHYDVPLVPAK
jgi:polyisoprenoid-binding protein YceI